MSEGFAAYLDLYEANKWSIRALSLGCATFYAVLYFGIKAAVTKYADRCWSQDAKSSWIGFINLTEPQKFLYVSYITSAINALGCLTFMYWGTTSCDPPADLRKDDLLFGNTYMRNEYCVDHPNIWEIYCLSQFLGYLCFDLVICVFFIGDLTTPAALQNLLHHFLGIVGAVGALVTGRYILTLSVASCINELSTPNVNIRYFLAVHKKTNGLLYIVNGLTFTVLFFIFRNVWQTWMVFRVLLPAFYRDNFGNNEDNVFITECLWCLMAMYFTLCGLNALWFHKIFSGCMKTLRKPKAK